MTRVRPIDRIVWILLSPIGALVLALYMISVWKLIVEPVIVPLSVKFPELRFVSGMLMGLETYVAVNGLGILCEPRLAHCTDGSEKQYRVDVDHYDSAFAAFAAAIPMFFGLLTILPGLTIAVSALLVGLGSLSRRYIYWFRNFVLIVGSANALITIAAFIYLHQ